MQKSHRPRGQSAVLALAALAITAPAAATDITTYHVDNLRTGWNPSETTLTPATVASSSFGLLNQVALDEQVDAQPLFVSGLSIAGGTYDVVYVATENNTIYAIDANTGNVLLSQNYGTAVPIDALPGGCNNNSNNMGINSTPVIDANAGLLYFISYTYPNSVPTFTIHAVSLTTLQDAVTPVPVSGTATYKGGATATFVSANNRQRSALLEANGNIYAGFASWCDINANVSRGWVLGWNAATLAPLPSSKLLNQRATDHDNFFLSSIWMSGYGIAADANGNLFFATGNSDYDGLSYDSTYNLDESVVSLSGDLSTVQGFYTPHGGPNGWAGLDKVDGDFGSAGVLLLPDQPGAYPHLAVAAGKQGPLYVLNRDNLGGLGGSSVALEALSNGGCWCGQSYYTGSDGVGRVVVSTGYNALIRRLVTSATGAPRLVADQESQGFNDDQDPGFFTSISSNGTAAHSAVVWAVTRPSGGNADALGVYLQAMDPAVKLNLLFSGEAGTWPFAGNANANLVPVVANGHVFVASYQNLSIYGLAAPGAKTLSFRAPPRAVPALYTGTRHELWATVTAITGDTLTVRTRTGSLVKVDIGAARAAHGVAQPVVGQASLIRGDYKDGVLQAKYVLHAKPHAAIWGPDR
jgi:hypothetical protein